MPRVRVASPTAEQIKANPREFALLQQVKADAEGTVNEQVGGKFRLIISNLYRTFKVGKTCIKHMFLLQAFAEYKKLYGNGGDAAAESELSLCACETEWYDGLYCKAGI